MSKTNTDENFPVASVLVRPEHRPIVLAFYDFVRTADDVADSAALPGDVKLERIRRMERTLLGHDDPREPSACRLRQMLAARRLSTVHAEQLLSAFRLDVTKQRYSDWSDLVGYCTLSAMPVGRFVLDVHGEDRKTWPASDALCAALQIINHLQDCGEDYRRLDRVYIPLESLNSSGASVSALGAAVASPPLRACIGELVQRVQELLRQSSALAGYIADWRLSLEVSVIQGLACELARRLSSRDPLSERVHLNTYETAAFAGASVASTLYHRISRRFAVARRCSNAN